MLNQPTLLKYFTSCVQDPKEKEKVKKKAFNKSKSNNKACELKTHQDTLPAMWNAQQKPPKKRKVEGRKISKIIKGTSENELDSMFFVEGNERSRRIDRGVNRRNKRDCTTQNAPDKSTLNHECSTDVKEKLNDSRMDCCKSKKNKFHLTLNWSREITKREMGLQMRKRLEISFAEHFASNIRSWSVHQWFSDHQFKTAIQPYTTTSSLDSNLLFVAGAKGLISAYRISTLPRLFPDEWTIPPEDLCDPDVQLELQSLSRFPSADVYTPPCLRFVGHSRWVSSLHVSMDEGKHNFFRSSKYGESLCATLLSASDDGSVALWRIPAHRFLPQPTLARLSCGQIERFDENDRMISPVAKTHKLHEAGIYSLDRYNDFVLTSSKDSTVALSRITASGFQSEFIWHDLHEGVIKCVRWRDGRVFSTCGNDKTISIVDSRVFGCGASTSRLLSPTNHANSFNRGVLKIVNAHDLSINTVRWQKKDPDGQILLSSSFDKRIKLWDLRKTCEPVHDFSPYSSHLTRSSCILHPEFMFNGDIVAAIAEKSRKLHLYSSRTGELLSDESLPEIPCALHPLVANNLVACPTSRHGIMLVEPTMNAK